MTKLRGIWGILIALFVVLSTTAGAEIFSADASSGPTSAGLNVLPGYGIANETSAVWMLNSTSHTWYSAAFTVNALTNEITFSTPLKQKISLVIVQTKNLSQNVFNLLQNGALFTYSQFAIAGTSQSTQLSSAYMYFGQPVNATSTNAKADKGITGYVMNQTLFNAAGSYFGSSVQLNPITYTASDFHSTAQYAFYLNSSKNATHVYSSNSITFTQFFEYTTGQKYPLVTYIAAIALALLLIAIVITYYAAPEMNGTEEERAKSFQTRKEIGVSIAAIAGAVGILIVEGFLGSFTPQGGWGAALASLFFFGLFIYAYTEIPQRQRYTRTLGIGLIGMIVGFVLNMFWPFGSIQYNFMTSNNAVALAYGWLAVLFFIAIAYLGLLDTKRYKLAHKHRVRERRLKA